MSNQLRMDGRTACSERAGASDETSAIGGNIGPSRSLRNHTGASSESPSSVCLVALLALLASGCLSLPRYEGAPSDHFDGRRFQNSATDETRGLADVIRWQLRRNPGEWGDWRPEPPGPPPPTAVTGRDLRVTYVNHGTVLVQLDGLNVLTDPIWSERASPVAWAGPRRVRPPGIRFEDLPPIDLVLVSHNHYDHLDVDTLRALQAHHPAMRVVTGLGNAPLLTRHGLQDVVELDWWQSHSLGDPDPHSSGTRATGRPVADVSSGRLEIVAVPAQHSSGRGTSDRAETLWVGFVLRSVAGTVYFAGDTAWGPHFGEIRARLGAPRLAILPIGAYRPRWFMQPIHVTPGQAVRAHRTLGAATSVAMHFGTFPLADDGEDEPVLELRRELGAQRVDPRHFWVLGFGEGRMVPPVRPSASPPESRMAAERDRRPLAHGPSS